MLERQSQDFGGVSVKCFPESFQSSVHGVPYEFCSLSVRISESFSCGFSRRFRGISAGVSARFRPFPPVSAQFSSI